MTHEIIIDTRTQTPAIPSFSYQEATPLEYCRVLSTSSCVYCDVCELPSYEPCTHCGCGGSRRRVSIVDQDHLYVDYEVMDGCMSEDDEYTILDIHQM